MYMYVHNCNPPSSPLLPPTQCVPEDTIHYSGFSCLYNEHYGHDCVCCHSLWIQGPHSEGTQKKLFGRSEGGPSVLGRKQLRCDHHCNWKVRTQLETGIALSGSNAVLVDACTVDIVSLQPFLLAGYVAIGRYPEMTFEVCFNETPPLSIGHCSGACST